MLSEYRGDNSAPDTENDHEPESRIPAPAEDDVSTGTVCKCGNTDHRHADPDLRNRWPFTAAYFLTERLTEEGEAHQIDEDRLWHELVHGAALP